MWCFAIYLPFSAKIPAKVEQSKYSPLAPCFQTILKPPNGFRDLWVGRMWIWFGSKDSDRVFVRVGMGVGALIVLDALVGKRIGFFVVVNWY